MSGDTMHIVYVHGFRGDHTSFQAFPSDLHNHLLPNLPRLQTWVYPTYRSVRPLAFAVKNLLQWLQSLPDGRIILSGHSMGGLLVAEAAIDPNPVARRIIGVLAFDSPYLGMHPHVVVSGIASLLPKKDSGVPGAAQDGLPDEGAVNSQANFVTSQDAFPSAHSSQYSLLSPERSPSPGSRSVHSTGSSLSPRSLSPTPSTHSTASLADKTMAFIQRHSQDPFVQWLQKHSDAPVAAMSQVVTQHFEFGSAMFDYGGLLERYRALERWDGCWVNFWTETVVPGHEGSSPGEDVGGGTPAGVRASALSPSERIENEFAAAMRAATEKEAKRRAKAAAKQRAKEEKAWAKELKAQREAQERAGGSEREASPHPVSSQTEGDESLERRHKPRHFVTLASTSKDRWLKVKIAGAADEVEAHCGIFIREKNLDYDAFIERVGDVVMGWIAA